MLKQTLVLLASMLDTAKELSQIALHFSQKYLQGVLRVNDLKQNEHIEMTVKEKST